MSLRLAATRSVTRAVNSRAMSTGLDYERTAENYESVLDRFAYDRACAVLRTPTSEACPKAMQAAIDGGFKIVEFTLTTPDCLQHLADFRASLVDAGLKRFQVRCHSFTSFVFDANFSNH